MKTNKILSTEINLVNIEKIKILLTKWKKTKKSHYICLSNVHSCTESIFNLDLKKANNEADLCLADGRPLFWFLNLKNKKKTYHLPGYLVTTEILSFAEINKLRVGFIGSDHKNLLNLKKELLKKYKKLMISYLYSPPFAKVLRNTNNYKKINRSKIDILFVCLGCPKQEIWMNQNKDKLKCTMLGVGAVVDFLSGKKILPNKFFEFLGLAWLVRLISEPRRLFWRYFKTNLLFIFLIILQLTSIKKFR